MRQTVISLFVTLLAGTVAGQTVTPSPYQVVLDSSGNPVSGALIYTYASGTSTPKTTYTDTTLAVPNANPIVADASGRYVAFLVSGQSYKFTIKTAAGATLKTVDAIQAIPASSGNLDVLATAGEALTAGQAVYLSDGSGGLTAGSWYKADADNLYSSTTCVIGVAPSAMASAATGTVRLAGRVTGLAALTIGASYYASATAGALTSSEPSANPRLIGVADTTTSLVLAIASPQAVTPAGMVAYFNLAACPTGWTEYTAARGLYIVGLPSGGTLAGKPAAQTALTDKENRPAGEHTHGATSVVTDPGHVHAYDQVGGSNPLYTAGNTGSLASVNTASQTTGITVATTVANNAGATAGTNAPYIQLLACTHK